MPKYKINVGNQQIEIDTGDEEFQLKPVDQKKIQLIIQKSKTSIISAKAKTLLLLKGIYSNRVKFIPKEVFALLNLYFRVPFPYDNFTLVDVQRCLSKIYENLIVLEKGFCFSNFSIHQAEMKVLKSNGASGYVRGIFFDTIWMQIFTPDFHEFKKTKPIDSPIFLNLNDFLSSPTKKLMRLLIHEASHKFTRTIDNAYISTTIEDIKNTKLFNIEMKNIQTSITTTTIIDTEKFPVEEEKIIIQLSESSTSGSAKKSWKDLTSEEALNNADSYAGFIMDLATCSGIELFNIDILVSEYMKKYEFNPYE